MFDISHAHFLRPYWLLALLLIIFFMWVLKHSQKSNKGWQSIVDAHLLTHLTGQKKQRLKQSTIFLPLFLSLIIIALAGPTIQKVSLQSHYKNAPLLILLELSNHMLSKDLTPNRLKRAKFKINDLLKENPGREVGLVAFAADSYVVTPITEDHETIKNLLTHLSPQTMPENGANLSRAIFVAHDTLKDLPHALLIAITSTNLSEEKEDVIKAVNNKGIDLILWPFITKAGAPLLSARGGFLDTPGGKVKLSKLNESLLNDLDKSSNIKHVSLSSDKSDISAITSYADSLPTKYAKRNNAHYDTYDDLGPYFVIAALCVFLLWFFIGSMPSFLLIFMAIVPIKESRAGISDYFKRDDQRAYEALTKGRASDAASLYEDDFAKGTAYFKAKEYEQAIKHLKKTDTADGRYNLGNAYAHAGKIDEAITAYNEALKINDDHTDARHNKEVLEKLKEEQENNNRSQDKKGDEQSDDQSDNQGDDRRDDRGESQGDDRRDDQGESQGDDRRDDQGESQGDDRRDDRSESQGDDRRDDRSDSQGDDRSESQGDDRRDDESDSQIDDQDETQGKQEGKHASEREKKEQDEKKGAIKKESDNKTKLDPNTQYYLDKIPSADESYLKRKFYYQHKKRRRKQR